MNKVVRIYRLGKYDNEYLDGILKEGWKVIFVTPIIDNGDTYCIDYILEKEDIDCGMSDLKEKFKESLINSISKSLNKNV